MTDLNTIVTHELPHLDELLGIWLLQKFGKEYFPGAESAWLVFSRGDGGHADKSPCELEQEGVVLIGIGGGRFDEHRVGSADRKSEQTAACLVAKALGVDDDPALEGIIKYAVGVDLNGSSNPFELGSLVTLMNQRYPSGPERVISWTFEILNAKYEEQKEFWSSTKEEFEKAEIAVLTGPKGPVKVVFACSDDQKLNKFARSVAGCRAGIVVQRKTSGNIQIFTNRFAGLRLYDVVTLIRLAEQKAKGKVITTNWQRLTAEGLVSGCEEWYFFEKGQMLLNGSLTAPDVLPTKLSMEEIREIITIGINPACFEPERAAVCAEGHCESSPSEPCPWYHFGLHRCRKTRYEMNHKQT